MLLERESQLAALRDYAREARGGEGRLVLIGGEPGIGKSALAERLAEDLPDARWSWGGCDGLFPPRPLGPLFDLAARGCLKRCSARSAILASWMCSWWRTCTGPTKRPSAC
jgi:chloramphenicol 3-O-phosphotransferase